MTRRVVIEADGGSRGNPGPAGFGAVVKDAKTDEVLAERCGGLGRATNNVAEYQGLIAGLRAAAELGASSVEARMDSKLVVEQMSGRWKIKHPALQPLAMEARNLTRTFERVRFEWIPRARNSHADRLANEAMDAQASGAPMPHQGPIVGGAPDSGGGGERAGAGKARRAEQPAGTVRPANAVPELSLNLGLSASGLLSDTGSAYADSSSPGVSVAERSGAVASERSGAQTGPPAAWRGVLGTPTRLLLLRHGQTVFSAQRRYSGRGDVPLTELGARQAAAAASRLSTVDDPGGVGGSTAGIVAVVASPLVRAQQTARAAADALGVDLVTHAGLTETDFGAWEGLTFAEAAARDTELHARWLADPSVPPPGGESFDVVHRRVRRTRDDLIARYGGATVVVVSHVTPIKALLRMALDVGPSVLYRLHLDLASLSVAEFYPDGHASVRLVNDTSHLC